MAVDISGGELSWEAVIDTDKAWDSVQKLSNAFNTSFQSKSAEAAINLLTQRLTDLQNKAENFRKSLSGENDPTTTSQLNAGLKTTQDQIAQVQKALDTLKGASALPQAFEDTNSKSQRLQVQLRALISDLAQMKQAGQDSLPEFQTKIEQATELEHSLTNIRKELQLASSNVAGFEALGQAFKGLIGGAEAIGGVFALLTDDEGAAAEITKNLIAAQSILNGIEEVGAVLNKNSALNVYLEALQRRFAAGTATEQAVATTALNEAEAANIAVTTESAASSKALSASQSEATLAVVGTSSIVLALVSALGLLFVAYEVLSKNVLQATQAEKLHQASLDALHEAQKQAADDIGKEQAALESLIFVAKDKNITDDARSLSLDEAKQKYPEYLHVLSLENIYTQQASDAIQYQIELIKQRALAQASEAVYAEKLKDVVNAQNELNRVNDEGASFWEKLAVPFKHMFDLQGYGITQTSVLKDKQEKLNDATIASEGAFKTASDAQENLAGKMGETTNNVNAQTESFNDLTKAIQGSSAAGKTFKIQFAQPNQVFDPKAYEADLSKTKDYWKAKVDLTKDGTSKNIQIQLNAAQSLLEKEKQNQNLFDQFGNPQIDSATKQPNAQAQAIVAGYQKTIADLQDQLSQKALQNISAAASALVITMQTLGQEGTKAYYQAQLSEIEKNRVAQVQAAKDNQGQIDKINADAFKARTDAENQYKTQQLTNQENINKARLTLVKQGSQEELQLRLNDIDIEAQKQIIAANKNQDLINAVAAKDKKDLEKQYAIEAQETQTNIIIAGIDTQLAAVQDGSQKELDLKKQLVDEKAQLEIEGAEKSIKNEQLLQAKISEIYANALKDKKKLDDEYYAQKLDSAIKNLDTETKVSVDKYKAVANDPSSTTNQKFNAQNLALRDQIAGLEGDIFLIQSDIDHGNGNAQQLQTKLNALKAQQKELILQQNNLGQQHQLDQIKEFAQVLGDASSSFTTLSQSLSTLNPKLSQTFAGLSNIAKTAESLVTAAGSGFTNPSADISAITSVISDIVNAFSAAKSSAASAKQAVDDFYTAIAVGEEKSAIAAREAALQRAQQNAKDLQGLKDEFDLLNQQKTKNQTEYNNLLNQIYQQSYISSVTTKTNNGPLGALNNLLGKGNTTTVQQLASLAGKSYNDLLDLYNKGQLTDKAKALFEQLQQLSSEGQNIQDSLNQLQDTLNQTFTGTTAQNISDSIKQGLADGKRSVADFADDFNSLMTNAILSAFEASQIEPAIADFYKKFAEMTQGTGGALSADQIKQLQAIYNQDINSFSNELQNLQQISGINFGSGSGAGNSLVGGIKAMTEQTAELLAGQFGGLRITAAEQLSELTQHTNYLTAIQNNTALTATRMQSLLDKFDKYETGAALIHIA